MDFLSEYESKELLKRYNINCTPIFLCSNEDEAVNKAKELGFPVVMKVVSKSIIHKSDAGGVLLNLNSEEEVRQAFRKLIALEVLTPLPCSRWLKKA